MAGEIAACKERDIHRAIEACNDQLDKVKDANEGRKAPSQMCGLNLPGEDMLFKLLLVCDSALINVRAIGFS
jgi:hypothetical protein